MCSIHSNRQMLMSSSYQLCADSEILDSLQLDT